MALLAGSVGCSESSSGPPSMLGSDGTFGCPDAASACPVTGDAHAAGHRDGSAQCTGATSACAPEASAQEAGRDDAGTTGPRDTGPRDAGASADPEAGAAHDDAAALSACDPGSTTTTWASGCPTAPPSDCVSGTWQAGGPDPDHAGFKLLSESEHFAVYSDENPQTAQTAVDHLELVWNTYFGSPIFMREPLCDSATKTKVSVHVHSDWGLTGGSWAPGRMGMWIGTGGLTDHWGLAHEFAHGVQAVQGGLACGGSSNYCGWIHESHANFMAHQLAEYRDNEHCSEMLFNAPHLYLGSTRDRYCNWQFMEFLKDKFCFSAVNAIWTSAPANDPFTNIMKGQDWTLDQANDFFGEWAMHNVTWDYRDPAPIVPGAGGDTDPAAAFRESYGPITDTSRSERRLRITQLEPLDDDYESTRRFMSPYFWAPQRYGYNVVRLHPESGAKSVGVTFRGVAQQGSDADFRWGLVATDPALTQSRYSALQRGSDGELEFCIEDGELLWLVVMATPSVQQHINWDQAYTSIYRYPYMVQLTRAWPGGFREGKPEACPSGTVRIANGGGCGPSGLPDSVYVGPYALILGGSVSGSARIEGHAAIVSGNVSGGTVGALSTIGSKSPPFNSSSFGVNGSAQVKTTFYPVGYFESGQSITGSAVLYGDVELRGQGFSLSSGSYSGIVSASEHTDVRDEVTVAPPYTWRP